MQDQMTMAHSIRLIMPPEAEAKLLVRRRQEEADEGAYESHSDLALKRLLSDGTTLPDEDSEGLQPVPRLDLKMANSLMECHPAAYLKKIRVMVFDQEKERDRNSIPYSFIMHSTN